MMNDLDACVTQRPDRSDLHVPTGASRGSRRIHRETGESAKDSLLYGEADGGGSIVKSLTYDDVNYILSFCAEPVHLNPEMVERVRHDPAIQNGLKSLHTARATLMQRLSMISDGSRPIRAERLVLEEELHEKR